MLMGRGMALQQHLPSMMQTKAWENILDFGQIDQLAISGTTRTKNIGSFPNNYVVPQRFFEVCMYWANLERLRVIVER